MDVNASSTLPAGCASLEAASLHVPKHWSVMSIALTCVIVVFVVPRLVSLFRNVCSPLASVPGPLLNKISSWPFTIATLKGTSHHFTRRLHERYGPIVVLAPGMVSVGDADEIRRIIKTEDWEKSHEIYGNFRQDPERPTLLAFTDKKAYGRRKRLMSAMFGIKCIRNMEPLMRQCVAVAVERLDRACDEAGAGSDAVVDMQGLIHGLAIDIIGITTFGQSFDVVEKGSHPLPTRLKVGLKIAAWMMLIPWIRKVPLLPTRDAYIDDFTRDIVEKRRREVAAQAGEAKTDLLQWLVKSSSSDAGSEFRTSDVQDESVVLLTAGSETTANAELFTLLLLAKHPAARRRLLAEVDAWYPRDDAARETDSGHSLAGMAYLQACINEAMRLFPGQSTGSPRQTTADAVVLGHLLPRGTTVFPSTQEAHLDARRWERPRDFVPERWLARVDEATAPFWPFSAGARVCIGKHFAMQEMHLSLVSLLRRFEFDHVDGQDESTVFRVAQQLRAETYMMRVRRRGGVCAGGEERGG